MFNSGSSLHPAHPRRNTTGSVSAPKSPLLTKTKSLAVFSPDEDDVDSFRVGEGNCRGFI